MYVIETQGARQQGAPRGTSQESKASEIPAKTP